MKDKDPEITEEKWYKRAWGRIRAIIQYIKSTRVVRALLSNAGALTFGVAGLGGVIATAGAAVPVIITSCVLGAKCLKTVADARNVRKTRNLDIENKLLIEFVTKSYHKQKILDLAPPKLAEIYDGLDVTQKGASRRSSLNEDKNRFYGIALAINNFTVFVKNIVIPNPIGLGVQVTQAVKATIDSWLQLKNTVSPKDLSLAKLPRKLAEYLMDHPDKQKELLKLVNEQIQVDGASYDSIGGLQKAILNLDKDIDALKVTVKDKDFYKDIKDTDHLENKLRKNLTMAEIKKRDVPQAELVKNNTWYRAVKESLYERDIDFNPDKPSGLTLAVRKEKSGDMELNNISHSLSNALIDAPLQKKQSISRDDTSLELPSAIYAKKIFAESKKQTPKEEVASSATVPSKVKKKSKKKDRRDKNKVVPLSVEPNIVNKEELEQKQRKFQKDISGIGRAKKIKQKETSERKLPVIAPQPEKPIAKKTAQELVKPVESNWQDRLKNDIPNGRGRAGG